MTMHALASPSDQQSASPSPWAPPVMMATVLCKRLSMSPNLLAVRVGCEARPPPARVAMARHLPNAAGGGRERRHAVGGAQLPFDERGEQMPHQAMDLPHRRAVCDGHLQGDIGIAGQVAVMPAHKRDAPEPSLARDIHGVDHRRRRLVGAHHDEHIAGSSQELNAMRQTVAGLVLAAESTAGQVVTGTLTKLDLTEMKGLVRTDLGKPIFFTVTKPHLFQP